MSMCAVNSTNHCLGSWRIADLVIFDDSNNNAAIDNEEAVFFRSSWPLKNGSNQWKNFRRSNKIVFRGDGSAQANGTFFLCPNAANSALNRAIIISKSGRPRFSADRNRDGVHENASGDAILRCQ